MTIFTKNTKNDPPREGKKLMFLTFLGWNTRFPHENIAISRSFFQGVFHASFGLVFEVFWGFSGAPPGVRWDPSGLQLGHFAASWVSWVASWSLVGPIWASVGWLCAFLEALWRKSGHQLGDSVSLGVRFGFFWVSGLRIKFFALSLDATGWVCGYWWSRFRSMSMRKYWSRATHKTKCTHVRNLPVHVYMLIHYMTCALAATNYWKLLDSNLTMAGSTRYDCNTYIRLHWSFWLMVYTCKDP